MKIKVKAIVVFLGLVFISCSEKPLGPQSKLSSAPLERAIYEQGLRSLSRNDFKGAIHWFSDLLSQYPSTRWISGANYNIGLALEGQENYPLAAEKYKKVIELNQSTGASRDEADALYRLSICYEAMNDDAKMTLALLQLQDMVKFMPKQVAEMEVPARLAASYARQGNTDLASEYYMKAEEQLKHYRRPPMTGDVMVWLPKTLYSMGYLKPLKNDVTVNDFRIYVQSLEQTQSWLVRSAELGNNSWSRKAAEALEDEYLSGLAGIRDFKVADNSDRSLAEKERQESQKAMAALLDGAISKLRIERLPSSPAEPEAGKLSDAFNTVNDVEKRVTEIVQAHNVQDQDTAEAQARQGLRREGKIIDKKNSP